MKIIAMADFHGSVPEIEKDFDIIIAAGDFCEFSEMRKLIFESRETGQNWVESRKARKLAVYTVETGRKVMEYLLSFGKPVLSIPGNTDFYWKKPVEELSERFQDIARGSEIIQGKSYEAGGLRIVGYGGTWAPESELEKRADIWPGLKKLMETIEELMPADIFVSHVPPYNTKLDIIKYGPLANTHYGSEFVRHIIEKYQPAFAISGHIHESAGIVKLGKTVAINPGPAYEGNYLVIDTETGAYKLRKARVNRMA